jgi:sugar lactone lactonase YvrE
MTSRPILHVIALMAAFSPVAAVAGGSPSVGTISNFGPDLANTPCANPEGLAIDSDGNFYTASDIDGSTTGTICVFSSTGTFTRVISIPPGPAGVAPLVGMLFEEPHTLFVVDTADGNAPNGRLLRVDTRTNAVTVLAGGFAFPNSIAEDLQGNLYVSDSALGTINRISQDGSHNVLWAADPLFLTSGFPPVGINDLAFDRTNTNLYATNTGDSRVLRIPLLANGNAGTVRIFADGATIDSRQNTTDALHGADGLAFDVQGNIYVAANQIGEIQVLSPAGRLIARYSGSGSTELDFPASLVFAGPQLYFTNASLFDDGVNSKMLVLQAMAPGWPLN